ncbi:uncharacterized protein LOC126379361 isoform X3 [Pectinophora gossypiella]|uniref:uncharacterized protein LOC126379361 isoform X3 n=1 Tax=Pectinophora gossypiella TaxID=13191 RepID=UPI00214E11E4|nr:uncharacterized protein LOC126379361 isoform X3 [Pectinophora gossypiella]
MAGKNYLVNTYCGTCLSRDRKLMSCQEDSMDVTSEYRQLTLHLKEYKVCFECRHLMDKLFTFQEQAMQAMHILKYQQNQLLKTRQIRLQALQSMSGLTERKNIIKINIESTGPNDADDDKVILSKAAEGTHESSDDETNLTVEYLESDSENEGTGIAIGRESGGTGVAIDRESGGNVIAIDSETEGSGIDIDRESGGTRIAIDRESGGNVIAIDSESGGNVIAIDSESEGSGIDNDRESGGNVIAIDRESGGNVIAIDSESEGSEIDNDRESGGNVIAIDSEGEGAVTDIDSECEGTEDHDEDVVMNSDDENLNTSAEFEEKETTEHNSNLLPRHQIEIPDSQNSQNRILDLNNQATVSTSLPQNKIKDLNTQKNISVPYYILQKHKTDKVGSESIKIIAKQCTPPEFLIRQVDVPHGRSLVQDHQSYKSVEDITARNTDDTNYIKVRKDLTNTTESGHYIASNEKTKDDDENTNIIGDESNLQTELSTALKNNETKAQETGNFEDIRKDKMLIKNVLPIFFSYINNKKPLTDTKSKGTDNDYVFTCISYKNESLTRAECDKNKITTVHTSNLAPPDQLVALKDQNSQNGILDISSREVELPCPKDKMKDLNSEENIHVHVMQEADTNETESERLKSPKFSLTDVHRDPSVFEGDQNHKSPEDIGTTLTDNNKYIKVRKDLTKTTEAKPYIIIAETKKTKDESALKHDTAVMKPMKRKMLTSIKHTGNIKEIRQIALRKRGKNTKKSKNNASNERQKIYVVMHAPPNNLKRQIDETDATKSDQEDLTKKIKLTPDEFEMNETTEYTNDLDDAITTRDTSATQTLDEKLPEDVINQITNENTKEETDTALTNDIEDGNGLKIVCVQSLACPISKVTSGPKPTSSLKQNSDNDESTKEPNIGDAKNEDKAGVKDNISVNKINYEDVISLREKERNGDIFQNAEFKCGKCVFGYKDQRMFLTHMERHLPDYGDIVCDICQLRFKNKETHEQHRQSHFIEFSCTITNCIFGSRFRRAVVYHQWSDHTELRVDDAANNSGIDKESKKKKKGNPTTFKCIIENCSEVFKQKRLLRVHMKTVHPTSFVKKKKKYKPKSKNSWKRCPDCPSKFINEVNLQRHKTICHENNLHCATCNVNFKSEISYRNHMVMSQSHDIKIRCDVSNVTSPSRL